jgi:hypothetical protein
VVTRYRIHLEDCHLAPGTINGRLAAVRRLAYEAAGAGLLSPELAASIRRVKGVRKLGGSAIARFCTVSDGQGRNFFVEEQYKRSAGENFKYHR